MLIPACPLSPAASSQEPRGNPNAGQGAGLEKAKHLQKMDHITWGGVEDPSTASYEVLSHRFSFSPLFFHLLLPSYIKVLILRPLYFTYPFPPSLRSLGFLGQQPFKNLSAVESHVVTKRTQFCTPSAISSSECVQSFQMTRSCLLSYLNLPRKVKTL